MSGSGDAELELPDPIPVTREVPTHYNTFPHAGNVAGHKFVNIDDGHTGGSPCL
jgi:hypothetical protein